VIAIGVNTVNTGGKMRRRMVNAATIPPNPAEDAATMLADLGDGRAASIALSQRAVALFDPFMSRWRDLFVEGRLDGWPGDPQRLDGYVPAVDMRHSFYIQPGTAVPISVQLVTVALIGELATIAEDTLARLLAPVGMAARNVRGSLRVMYYPPTEGPTAPAWTARPARAGAMRAVAHADHNLITLIPGALAPGLQIADELGWRDVLTQPGRSVVLVGRELAQASRDRLPATLHRVRNPEPGEEAPRMAIAYHVSAALFRVDD
jgi:hypothetical protein